MKNITMSAAEKETFIEALNFAANILRDNRSRRYWCFEAIERRKSKTTKKAREQELALNAEARHLSNCLIHLAEQPDALENAFKAYKNKELFGL